ncbi:MAG TPA: glycerol-3-phosphate dehydrogenase [Rhizobiales bacterium]|nr:aerobic glycerol-3-phosphate dehydrogenase [bacterium BMS3Bbin10]HDO51688.1 glycerol-3-phosphate dehydrogenase [Hyphomicrobiales bacterium]
MADRIYDILVIGGGINGAMVARDAAGRGLSVLLVEKDDLASGTSSASSKLIHGGLRYLEHYDFSLVRESLREREILLRNARHVIRPMRFILPHVRGGRPVWLVRIGLWLYDHLSRNNSLPRCTVEDLTAGPYAQVLKPEISRGFAYSDCWADDARLVVLTALGAARLGAEIMPRTRCISAHRDGRLWRAKLVRGDGSAFEIASRALVNAAGPWAREILTGVAGGATKAHLRLVKGSHIVVPRLHEGDHAFLLQNDDGRIIFVIPYEGRYSLIGTTEIVHEGPPGPVGIDAREAVYLCDAVNRYFKAQIKPADTVWSFAGLRPLLDDGHADPASITRGYILEIDRPVDRAPLISIFGGKLTTARQLAERVVDALDPPFRDLAEAWTGDGLLPGGEIADFDAFLERLKRDYSRFDADFISALARRHGTSARKILGEAVSESDLGRHFGGGLYGAEVDWLIDEEWARETEDILWRRTKCGLGVDAAGERALARYMAKRKPR